MVRILKDLDMPIEGRHVLIVEDIVDSGLTLQYLLRTLAARGPASLEVCALLTKPERRTVDLPTRYIGLRSRTSSRSATASTTRAYPQPAVRGRVICHIGTAARVGRPGLARVVILHTVPETRIAGQTTH